MLKEQWLCVVLKLNYQVRCSIRNQLKFKNHVLISQNLIQPLYHWKYWPWTDLGIEEIFLYHFLIHLSPLPSLFLLQIVVLSFSDVTV